MANSLDDYSGSPIGISRKQDAEWLFLKKKPLHTLPNRRRESENRSRGTLRNGIFKFLRVPFPILDDGVWLVSDLRMVRLHIVCLLLWRSSVRS